MYESRVNDRREAVASSWLSRRDKISNKVLLIVVIVPILSVICVFSISVVKNHGNEIRNVAISSPKAEKYTDSRDRFQGVRDVAITSEVGVSINEEQRDNSSDNFQEVKSGISKMDVATIEGENDNSPDKFQKIKAAAGISESDILSGKEQNNGFHSSFQESTTAVGSSEMDVANSVTNEEHSYLHNSFQLIRNAAGISEMDSMKATMKGKKDISDEIERRLSGVTRYVVGYNDNSAISYIVTPLLSLLDNDYQGLLQDGLLTGQSYSSLAALQSAYSSGDTFLPLPLENINDDGGFVDISGEFAGGTTRRLDDPAGGWGSGPSSVGNCYRYATKDPKSPTSVHSRPPGDIPILSFLGKPHAQACAAFMAGAKGNPKDGLTDPPCGANKYKICMYAAEKPAGQTRDIHVYREDAANSWSHKRGSTAVTLLDASGNAITDPDTCDRDYTPSGGLNYQHKCGCVCVPDGGINFDDQGGGSDPIIMGLMGQVFKFDGRGDAWYSFIASNSFNWNMQFKRYDTCPEDENMFQSGMSISVSSSKTSANPKDETVLIVTTPEPILECTRDPGVICLGGGTLHLSFDGGDTFVSKPGDYYFAPNSRLVAHNTFAACSRKWYDYEVSSPDDKSKSLRAGGRRMELQEKEPLQYLLDHEDTMINLNECKEWIQERVQKSDLFQQTGLWSTIYIDTPLVSFHVEYRRSDPQKVREQCDFQSLDAWMTNVSPVLNKQNWNGILGETKNMIVDSETKQPIISDRKKLLRGKHDADYEVDGPFGFDHHAMVKTSVIRI